MNDIVTIPPQGPRSIFSACHRAGLLGAALLVLGFSSPLAAQSRSWQIDVLADTFGITKAEQVDVPIDAIHQGCPARDCIPSIDKPGFGSTSDAFEVDDEDLVLGLDFNGVVRAYPAFILNHHEIVNDTVGDVPVAITYCPLCGSGVAFRRELDGEAVEFGVSGLLHNSDLILYDRASESLWQQITGTAIAGPRRGEKLTSLPLAMTTWKEWRSAHPGTGILVANGIRRFSIPNKQPYGNYDSSKRLMFPANPEAARKLHPKQVVHGIRIDEGAAAVTERHLTEAGELSMTLGDVTLKWRRGDDGSVQVVREDSGENVLAHRMFWFAWYSFNTDTALLDRSE